MTGVITMEGVSFVVGLIVVLAGFWWRIDSRMRKVETSLADYKLQAAKEFASVEHLKEVEVRLIASIDRLADRIDRLLTRIEKSE